MKARASNAGATWVYTRSGGVWTQQGSKLVGTVAEPRVSQGTSVTLSADGSTALVGGPFDNSQVGAAWVFLQPSLQVAPLTDMFADPNWLTPSSTSGTASSGTTVSGPQDNLNAGAAWVYTRSGGVWTQLTRQ